MRKIVAISLIFIISISIFQKGLVVGYFMLNQSYIAANFCENLDKPAMKCDGKCYLRKQLQVEEKPAEQPQGRKLSDYLKESKSPILFFEQIQPLAEQLPAFTPTLPRLEKQEFYHFYQNSRSTGHELGVLHPPALG